MKRRNIDCLKIRRPVKRSKLTEGLYGNNNFIYIKFMIFWALVLLADFLLEFRFEFLWPIWLLVRSVYDSFKYQGFAFSVFFVFIALTSDMVCFLFIPVHWLFFAASTYVWVQYVWHTERGVCLPTILLWFLFVYIEASVRLKDLRHLPSHMDLCRPFAAHCIGYPVVTLGFGFKSYMSYRIRLRKQKDVAKENEFYMKLLVEALPEEQQELYEKQKKMLHEQQAIAATTEKAKVSSKTDESVSSSVQLNVSSSTNNTHLSTQQTHSSNSTVLSSRQTVSSKRIPDKGEPLSNPSPGKPTQSVSDEKPITTPKESSNEVKKTPKTSLSSSSSHGGESEYLERKRNLNDLDTFDSETDVRSLKTFLSTSSIVTTPSSSKSGAKMSNGTVSLGNGSIPNGTGINCTQLKQDRKAKNKEGGSSHSPPPHKDEYCQRLETDVRRLKTEIHQSRQLENELRNHILTLGTSERSARAELAQMQHDNEGLQSKLVGALSTRQSDKNNLTALEKKLAEERKARATLENQLAQERRGKRGDDNSLTRATSTLPTKGLECTNDACKIRRTQLEAEIKQLRSDLKSMEDRLRSAENEALMFRQRSAPPSPPAVPLGLAGSETEFLKNSLSSLKDRNSHLENSLSAETRIKLDLFSALGDARRQLEIRETMLAIRDREILDLKSRVAEVLAVMPGMDLNLNISIGSPLDLDMDHTTFSKLLSGSSMSGLLSPSLEDPPTSSASFLDPNAASYTPKLTNGDAFDA